MDTPRAPTAREVRRLASDHNFVLGASSKPPRLGLWPFVATNLSLPVAFCAGIIFIVVSIVYTGVTSKQILECPDWAIGCRSADRWTVENLGTIQGIITLIYLIGMAALAYSTLLLCEAAIWPLAHKQWFTLGGLNDYLATTRGSIMSAPGAIMSVRSLAAGTVLAAALTVILLPFTAPPLIGHAFTPAWQDVELRSNYTSGGGINELYAQTNPPTSVIVQVLANYASWAANPSSEPLPDHRQWYVDRQTLSQRGNLSAHAVKLESSISCTPHELEQFTRDNIFWNGFKTNMSRTNSATPLPGGKQSSSETWFRPQPGLTLWANSFDFISPTQTRTTLVFAAINGTIQGGTTTPLHMNNLTSASSISCEVDISASDSILTTLDSSTPAPANLPKLSSLESLSLPNSSLNELLLWFTVSPLLTGPSIDGAQPTFFNSSQTHLPIPFTSSPILHSQNDWTIRGLESFIHLSIGALAQSTSSFSDPSSGSSSSSSSSSETPIILTTTTHTKKLLTPRTYLLLIPPLITLLVFIALAVYNSVVHKKLGIPVMRLLSTGELLKSSQTRYLRTLASTDAAKTYLPNELADVEVKYGVDRDGIVGFVGGGPGTCSEVGGFVRRKVEMNQRGDEGGSDKVTLSAEEPSWERTLGRSKRRLGDEEGNVALQFGYLHSTDCTECPGVCTVTFEELKLICGLKMVPSRPPAWIAAFVWFVLHLLASIGLQIAGSAVATLGSQLMGFGILVSTSILRGIGIASPEEWMILGFRMRDGSHYGTVLLSKKTSRT
ncbi:hypothetical protein QBC43DRAFT_367851 [Cladorrhinum sp. PSN259]|nr:hypothetical protein QBC43DRAFT_367851 [Cladorrhinum sp. PSN259]